MPKSTGRIIVICAPSGTGKSTLIQRLKSERPVLEWSVSCTTRPMRTGEKHGQDYFFIAVTDFEERIKKKDFIEYAKVHSNYYGTSKQFVDEGLRSGRKMLFDLDVQGADSIKQIYGDEAKVIFIEPPTIEELERRLRSRATDAPHVIEERVNNARSEIKRKNDFDYLVVNDEVEKAYQQLKKVVDEILK